MSRGGAREHTRRVIENIKAILEAAGASLENIVKITVYLADGRLYKEFNEVYSGWFGENPPARR